MHKIWYNIANVNNKAHSSYHKPACSSMFNQKKKKNSQFPKEKKKKGGKNKKEEKIKERTARPM